MSDIDERRAAIAAARAALGIDRLVLAIHDVSFPADANEDVGVGSPHSCAGRAFLRHAADVGFTGVQLGPQGKTSSVNPSPYDGTVFARSPASIALRPLAFEDRWQGLLPQPALDAAVALCPPGSDVMADHAAAARAQTQALRAAFAQLGSHRVLKDAVAAFARTQASWLDPDSAFEALAAREGTDDWRRFAHPLDRSLFAAAPGEEEACARRSADLFAAHSDVVAFNHFCQFVVHAQHGALRDEAQSLGLKLYGDLQVGVSQRDLWWLHPLFLPDFLLGAPPSRTNPLGQAWAYPVLDPRLFRTSDKTNEGAALRFVRARLTKLLTEFDGLRIDHPHGLICPWVYRADDPDPLHAVQTGGRLFESPDRPDLAAFALVAREQLDDTQPRYSESWVRSLTPAQVADFAVVFDVLMATARGQGRQDADIASEVLSTCPLPVADVLRRHGLGRFRVTQKADPDDATDPYRTARAAPADWVMTGTHDTPPVWAVVPTWSDAKRTRWAHYLADRLIHDPAARPAFVARVAADPKALCRALLADLFVGPARHVSVFFADLLGMTDVYNRPGEVHPDNWRLRVPTDHRAVHAARMAEGAALDVAGALVLALQSCGDPTLLPLIERLKRCAVWRDDLIDPVPVAK